MVNLISSEEKDSLFGKIFFLWVKSYIKDIIKYGYNLKKVLCIPQKYCVDKNYNEYLSYCKNKIKGKFGKLDFIKALIYTYRKSLFLYFFITFITIGLQYLSSIIYPKLINLFCEKSNSGEGLIVLIFVIFVYIFIKFINIIFKEHKVLSQWKLITSIQSLSRNILFQNLMNSKIKYINQNFEGKLINMYSVHCAWMRGIIYLVEAIVNFIGVFAGLIILIKFLGIGGLLGGIILISFSPVLANILNRINKNDGELHNLNSQRLACISEIVNNIKQIKLLNLQSFIIDKVNIIRKKQSTTLLKRNKRITLLKFVSATIIPLIGIVSIGLAIVTNYKLNFGEIFASFMVLNILNTVMTNFVDNINIFRQTLKSEDYIIEFLNTNDYEKIFYKDIDNELIIKTNNLLKNIKKEELVVIIGEIGSGKTKLLQDIKDIINYNCEQKKFSYISNNEWILPASIKENIILNNVFNKDIYLKSIILSMLNEDIQDFKDKDEMLVNNNGANLSGGQVVRLELARSIYSNPDIILMDNVLNSLDINIKENIIENLVLNYWNNKTRIIVTSDKSLIEKADKIILMENNEILFCGKFSEFKRNYKYEQYCEINQLKDKNLYSKDKTKKNTSSEIKKNNNEINNKLTGVQTLFNYINIIMKKESIFVFISLFLMTQIIELGSKFLVSSYSETTLDNTFVAIYFVLAILLILVNLSRFYMIFIGNIKGAQWYHEKMIDKLVNSKVEKFYEFDSGSILSRFSNDINILDNNIGDYILGIFESILSIGITIILMVYTSPYMIIIVIMFLLRIKYIQKEIRITAKFTSKLVNSSHEPCLSLLKSSIDGLEFIKDQKLQNYILSIWSKYIINVLNSEYTRQAVNRYQFLNMGISGVFVIFMFLLLLSISNVNSDILVVTLTSSIIVLDNFQSWLINIRHTEIGISSLKRVNELVEFDQEELDFSSNSFYGKDIEIKIKDLSCKYKNSDYIINKFSIDIKPKERVLVIGKTGSGKTTFLNCLSKIIDYEGTIKINETDLKDISVYDAREIMFSVPQKIFLFSGTIRENLDPFNEFDDQSIWNALNEIGLSEKVNMLNEKLNSNISPHEPIFSSGEQQLLSLVRAILKKPHVLLIDEGNSKLGKCTEEKFYKILKNNFSDSTIISIAHNTSNYNFYDKVINIENFK